LRTRPGTLTTIPEDFVKLTQMIFSGKAKSFVSGLSVGNYDSPFTELVRQEVMESETFFSSVRLEIAQLCLLIE
jgi:hypothetical protein